MTSRYTTQWAVSILLASAVLLGGCRWAQDHRKTATGAGIGAATGAVIGGMTEGKEGAVWGGVLGALAGGSIGAYMDHKDATAEETKNAYGYSASQGTVLKIKSVATDPGVTRPGSTVELTATYALLAPPNTGRITVTEARVVTLNGEQVAQHSRKKQRTPGTYTSKLPIALPEDAETGNYQCEFTLVAEGDVETSATTFVVQ